MVGRHGLQPPRSFYEVGDLVKEMEYHGIGGALVYHALAKESSPPIGNDLLLEEIKGHPELLPCWVVMPHQTGEMPSPHELVEDMKKKGVKAVRMYPDEHAFSFDGRTCGGLLSQLEAERIPLLLDLQMTRSKGYNWGALGRMCESYPNLPIILTRMNWLSNRHIYPLLEEFKNLYVETSFYQVHRGIEDFCMRFGAGRLIFGTRMPICSPGASIMMITHSDIPEKEKRMIAGGNLGRLLKLDEIPGKANEPHPDDDGMLSQARRGLPITGHLIIDAHVHIGPLREFHIPSDAPEGVIKSMDTIGIDKAVVSSLLAIQSDYKLGNNMVAEAIRKYPGRIVGYAVANPHFKEGIEAELKRCFDELKMSAIKIHPAWHEYPPDGGNYRPVWEFAKKRRGVVLAHTGGSEEEMAKYEKLSSQYPEVTFILAHAGNSYKTVDNYIRVAKKRDNIFLEITFSSVPFGIVEHLVEGAGADKVIYGSDMTYRDPKPQLGWVIYAKISEEDKKKVLGTNMARILEKSKR
jgi:predicted TIM-barrel fold metal-dependent hydrolase